MEKIGVIGSGRMGTAIGSAFARAGAEVFFGTRSPNRAVNGRSGSHRDAVEFGDVIVFAVRWSEARQILADIGDFSGKILLSCTNAETDEAPLAVGFTTSAGELIASWAPTARVVEAFIDTYAAHLDASPHFSVTPPTVLHCGDDDESRAVAGAADSQPRFRRARCRPARECALHGAARAARRLLRPEARSGTARLVGPLETVLRHA